MLDDAPARLLVPARPPAPFAVRTHSCAGRSLRVALAGELDLATAPGAAKQLKAAQAESSLVWLDLRGLTFMDSSGVHLVIAAHTRARRRGGRLVIVNCPPPVRRVFELTGVLGHLEFAAQPRQTGALAHETTASNSAPRPSP